MYPKTSYLFVYGTLLSALDNYWVELLKENTNSIRAGYIQGKLYDFGDYPGIVSSTNPKDQVVGEIVELKHPDVLLVLDDYEGYFPEEERQSEYEREIITAFSDQGEQFQAWAYFFRFDLSRATLISSGNYLEFLQKEQEH